MQNVRIKIKSGVAGVNQDLAHMGRDVIFEIDSSKFETILNQYTTLDKFNISDILVVFVGPKSDSGRSFDDFEYRDYGNWWNTPPEDKSNYYAVGSAPKYFYDSSRWRKALKEAKLALARQLSINVKSLNQFNGHGISKVIIEESDVILTNWREIARHYSPESQTYHVLIKMPKE